MEESEYRGYRIPKSSIVLLNTWAITRDEAMYPDAATFNPDRFEGNTTVMDPRQFVFGVGRRVCPGMHYAEICLWTAMATLLATTDMKKALDEDGVEISPALDFGGGLISPPEPFQCAITRRSDTALAMLQQSLPRE